MENRAEKIGLDSVDSILAGEPGVCVFTNNGVTNEKPCGVNHQVRIYMIMRLATEIRQLVLIVLNRIKPTNTPANIISSESYAHCNI